MSDSSIPRHVPDGREPSRGSQRLDTQEQPAGGGAATLVAEAPEAHPATDLAELRARLAPLSRALVAHPLYGRLERGEHLRLFVEHHVFAVWDFMSLLKALQRGLTCIEVPWVPSGDPGVRRFVNALVLAEESDVLPDGRVRSHLELYREAMVELGADPAALDQFLVRVGRGAGVAEALAQSGAPCHARSFVQATWRILRSRSLPSIAAAFALGREEILPAMFRALVRGIADREGLPAGDLLLYLERHVDQDSEEHGPMAERLLREVLGDRPEAWLEAEQAARLALKARLALWDGLSAQLDGVAGTPC